MAVGILLIRLGLDCRIQRGLPVCRDRLTFAVMYKIFQNTIDDPYTLHLLHRIFHVEDIVQRNQIRPQKYGTMPA